MLCLHTVFSLKLNLLLSSWNTSVNNNLHLSHDALKYYVSHIKVSDQNRMIAITEKVNKIIEMIDGCLILQRASYNAYYILCFLWGINREDLSITENKFIVEFKRINSVLFIVIFHSYSIRNFHISLSHCKPKLNLIHICQFK